MFDKQYSRNNNVSRNCHCFVLDKMLRQVSNMRQTHSELNFQCSHGEVSVVLPLDEGDRYVTMLCTRTCIVRPVLYTPWLKQSKADQRYSVGTESIVMDELKRELTGA